MEAPQHSPRVEALLEEAHLLQMRGELREAVDRCRAALALAPEEPAALELLGDLLRSQGNVAAAAEQYGRARAAAPHRMVLEQKYAEVTRELAQHSGQREEKHTMRQDEMIVTTGTEVAGRQVVAYLGIVRGIVVRTPTISQGVMGGLQSIFGGNIEAYANVCEQAREEAYVRMALHARAMGANAVIGMRYDATEFGQGATEVLAYGTAVRLE